MEIEMEAGRSDLSDPSPSYALWSFSSLLAHCHFTPCIVTSRLKATACERGGGDDEEDGGQTVHSLRSIPKCRSNSSDSAEGASPSDSVQLKNDETDGKKRQPGCDWLMLLLRFPFNCYSRHSQSLVLENTASVARDHLANERTYLAWLRTSLSTITVGAAITQLHRSGEGNCPSAHPELGRDLGIFFVGTSLVFLYIGNARYFHAQDAMRKGYFPSSRGSVVTVSVAVLTMLVAMCVVLVLERNVY